MSTHSTLCFEGHIAIKIMSHGARNSMSIGSGGESGLEIYEPQSHLVGNDCSHQQVKMISVDLFFVDI